jgi:predicted nucleotidyltransferase
MIPAFNEHGCLPEGIYDCTMKEATQRFGVFQSSDRRPRLWARLTEFIRQVKGCGFVETVIVDGSFVTSKPAPSDIDLVLVVATSHDFSADLTPAHYSLLAQRRVRRRFGFDIVVVKNGSENLELASVFFQQVKQRPSVKKGILRIRL